MQYENTPVSQNIEDRRGQGGGLGVGGGGLGVGAIIIVLVISYFTGISPQVLMSGAEMATRNSGAAYTQPATTGPAANANDPMRNFLAHVLGQTEAVWTTVLPQQAGVRYQPATLVIYDGATRSGCGGARAAMGRLLPARQEGLSRHLLLPRHEDDTAAAATRLRLCGRARGRHHVQDLLGILARSTRPATRQRDPGERPFGPHSLGRLPCQRLGHQRQPGSGGTSEGGVEGAGTARRSATTGSTAAPG